MRTEVDVLRTQTRELGWAQKHMDDRLAVLDTRVSQLTDRPLSQVRACSRSAENSGRGSQTGWYGLVAGRERSDGASSGGGGRLEADVATAMRFDRRTATPPFV